MGGLTKLPISSGVIWCSPRFVLRGESMRHASAAGLPRPVARRRGVCFHDALVTAAEARWRRHRQCPARAQGSTISPRRSQRHHARAVAANVETSRYFADDAPDADS